MTPAAYLFDFDNTLADTDRWKSVRKQAGTTDLSSAPWLKYYAEVGSAPKMTTTSGIPIGDIAYQLIQDRIRVSIVTTSPRQAPIAWFKAHYGITPRTVIGFQDVAAVKPNPEPQLTAM